MVYFTILDSVPTWLTHNRLTVNPSKTEYLLIGNFQQRSKVTTPAISFGNSNLIPSDSCRNLGVILDSDLSLKNTFHSSVRHHIIKYVNFVKFALAWTLALLNFSLTLLFPLDLTTLILFSMVFLTLQ